MLQKGAIAVHGGIYKDEIPDIEETLIKACQTGLDFLSSGNAVDAVEEAVKILEDDPHLNAGTGSYPNLLGEVEMSASIMKDDLSCGGVAGIKAIRHPISVARGVMEKTPHVLLVGEGANLFARLLGFESYNPVSELTVKTLKNSLKKAANEQNSIYAYYLEQARKKLKDLGLGTVGAVVLDSTGHLAAGTSTGGIEMQLPGRVGDSPIPGCGTYACRFGAVSMTGEGEGIIKLGLARRIAEWMETLSPQEAVNRGMEMAREWNVTCGAIAINARGEFGWGQNGGNLSFAYLTVASEQPLLFKRL
ncbi:isoaspartyl peptidase/L-asparaginase family protein [Atrimonas thermophila]|uniref:isoaspartyl peptidase/L-asparaginase family protein n=1 Tax=Atrimonas thermophila TaxID=3064161 RepID=UPI00399C5C89